jgi:16S rRNA (adenine1518-N6/adenine1519-N6)-dimethyltransferase
VSLPRARKALGQHFLTDQHILARIAAALDLAAADVVIEVGSGTGTLTRVLAAAAGKVVAIEKDERLAEQCRMQNAESRISNVEIVVADALKLDWQSAILHSAFPLQHCKIAGNIPYNITTPLLERVVALHPERIVFLVQAEVADRIAAAPGSKIYGGLSVGIQTLCRAEKLFTVRAGSFTPPPRVHSAVIRLWPRPAPAVSDAEIAPFRTFVTACFSRRRKQLRNVVRAVLGAAPEVIDAGLAALGIAPEARPETLAPEAFVRMWRWVLASGGPIVK